MNNIMITYIFAVAVGDNNQTFKYLFLLIYCLPTQSLRLYRSSILLLESFGSLEQIVNLIFFQVVCWHSDASCGLPYLATMLLS